MRGRKLSLRVNNFRKLPKMTTSEQIEANKENAQHSTGPEDTSKTRYNGLTHGLTAKTIVREEDKEAIEEFRAILNEELKPSNAIEGILIERMTIALWKINKAVQIESTDFHNSEVNAEDSNYMTSMDSRFSKKKPIVCIKISENCKAIQEYQERAENSLYKAINLLLKLRNEKLGSVLQNTP